MMLRELRNPVVFLIMSLGLIAAAPAAAQEGFQQPADRGFAIQNFEVAPGYGSFLTLEGAAAMPDSFGYGLGGMFNYQYRPLVVHSCAEVEDRDHCVDWKDDGVPLVEHHLALDVHGVLSFKQIFEAGLVIPFVLYQTGDDATQTAAGEIAAPSDHAGIGDPRLHLKLDLLHGVFGSENQDLGLALIPVISFPVGNAAERGSFVGDSSVTVHPKLAFGARLGRIRLGLNGGYVWRENKRFLLTEIGPALTYGAAMEIDFTKRLSGILELFGENGFKGDVTESPLEWDAALRYDMDYGVTFTGGIGTGIAAGVGSPAVRLFAGLGWTPPPEGDSDRDGLMDSEDQCPAEPEDADGFEDDDGCLDNDNDQDGLLDWNDICPNEAEDEDGLDDGDGCPEEDIDKDGILDQDDQCPKEAEDKDGFEDENGCPEPDNDGDGILDGDDQCGLEPEDIDQFEDEDGCPEVDNDLDGIADATDECPQVAEVFNGIDDSDGCPDEGEQLLTFEKGKIQLLQKIRFKTGKDKIIGKRSFLILDAVVAVLQGRPDIEVRIEGHTDNVGKREKNVALSEKRASAVLRYLVENDVDPDRLSAVGHGPDRPIADNKTRQGKAANRRVEFVVTKQ